MKHTFTLVLLLGLGLVSCKEEPKQPVLEYKIEHDIVMGNCATIVWHNGVIARAYYTPVEESTDSTFCIQKRQAEEFINKCKKLPPCE